MSLNSFTSNNSGYLPIQSGQNIKTETSKCLSSFHFFSFEYLNLIIKQIRN